MREFLRDYFSVSKQDRYGVLLLMILIIVSLIIPALFPYFIKSPSQDFSAFQKEIEAVLPLMQKKKKTSKAKYSNQKYNNQIIPANELFTFNPNELDKEKAQKLGFTEFVASNIHKYLEKGGRFYKKEDFQKIHGVSEQDYQQLESFMLIPDRQKYTTKYPKKSFGKKQKSKPKAPELLLTPFAFDPNNITLDLAKELGFSEKLGERIVKYLATGANFRKKEDFQKMYGLTDEMYQVLEPYIEIERKEKELVIKDEKADIPIELTEFNPNELTKEKAMKLGLNANVGQAIENYLKTGARFKTKEDLKKIYAMKDDDFQRLEDYIIIPEAEKPKPIVIDINTAGVEEWKKISGIGDFFANKIVEYREALGGFVSLEQLKEVYKMDEKFEGIKNSLQFQQTKPQQMNINVATVEELRDHPYLDFDVAKSVVKIREQHGPYTDIEQVTKSFLIDEDLFEKLQPYLTIDFP